jgi:hypothetical protein
MRNATQRRDLRAESGQRNKQTMNANDMFVSAFSLEHYD